MKKRSLLSSIANSLFRRKRKNESVIKYILLLSHLWTGLIAGLALTFICLTGATYIFKSEIIDFSSRTMLQRETPAQLQVETSIIINNFSKIYHSTPTKLIYPEDNSKNIEVIGGNHSSIAAYADRETGAILGERSQKVKSFFTTVFYLHRWFNLKGDNRHIGSAIVGASTLLFLFLLISGIVLWLPTPRKKKNNPWKNKFTVRFKYKFTIWNRDLHLNIGAIAAIFLIVISWSGLYFSYDWVRTLTVDTFKPASEKVQHPQDHGHKRHHGGEKQEKTLDLDFDALITEANKHLNYSGEVSLILAGRGISSPVVRKENKHNLLGAVLYDDIKFSKEGKFISEDLFKNKPLHAQISETIKDIHTGAILGLKSKIIYFLLSLIAAYLPISGYIMWWKRIK